MSRKVFHLAANPFKPHFLLSMLFVMLLVGMAVVNDAQIRTLILIPALIIYVAVFLLMLFESQHLAKTIVQELQAQAGSAGTLVEQAKSLPKPVRAGA
ncbi:hypothetical protein FJZ26_03675 [Candidatus Parvarchaeota archaeon]|nr:hypothetical protein [Candidatus Parvarchaeota archaeon]